GHVPTRARTAMQPRPSAVADRFARRPAVKLGSRDRHVISPMAGVLLDTEQIYTAVTHRITSRYGKVFDWSVKSDMLGRPAMDSAEYLVGRLELPIDPQDYLRERTPMLEALLAEARAIPGAEAFTRELPRQGD